MPNKSFVLICATAIAFTTWAGIPLAKEVHPNVYKVDVRISDIDFVLSTTVPDDASSVPFSVINSRSFPGACNSDSSGARTVVVESVETGTRGSLRIERSSESIAVRVELWNSEALEDRTIQSVCGELVLPSASHRELLQTVGLPLSGGAFDLDLDGRKVSVVVTGT